MFWDTPEAYPTEVQTPTGAEGQPLVLSDRQKEKIRAISREMSKRYERPIYWGTGISGGPVFSDKPDLLHYGEEIEQDTEPRLIDKRIKPYPYAMEKEFVGSSSYPSPQPRLIDRIKSYLPAGPGLTAQETGEQIGARLPQPSPELQPRLTPQPTKEPMLAFEPFGGSIGLTPEAVKTAGLMPGYVAPGQEHPGFISPKEPVPELQPQPVPQPTEPVAPWGERAYQKIMKNPLVLKWQEWEKSRSRGGGPEGEPAITPEEATQLLGWFGPELLNFGKGVYGEEGFIESYKKEEYLKATGGLVDDIFRATIILPLTGMLRIGGEAAIKALRGAAQKAQIKKADELVRAAVEATRPSGINVPPERLPPEIVAPAKIEPISPIPPEKPAQVSPIMEEPKPTPEVKTEVPIPEDQLIGEPYIRPKGKVYVTKEQEQQVRLAHEIEKAKGEVTMAELTKSPRLEEVKAKRDALLDQRDEILRAEARAVPTGEGIILWRAGRETGNWWSTSKDYARDFVTPRRPLDNITLPKTARILDARNFDEFNKLLTKQEEIQLSKLGREEVNTRKIYKEVLERNNYDGMKYLEEGSKGETVDTYFINEPSRLRIRAEAAPAEAMLPKVAPKGAVPTGVSPKDKAVFRISEAAPAEVRAAPIAPLTKEEAKYINGEIKKGGRKWKAGEVPNPAVERILIERGIRLTEKPVTRPTYKERDLLTGEVVREGEITPEGLKIKKEKPTPQPTSTLRESIEIPLLRQIKEAEVTATKGDTLNALVGNETYTWKAGENWVSRPGKTGERDHWFTIDREKIKTVGVKETPKWVSAPLKVGEFANLERTGEKVKVLNIYEKTKMALIEMPNGKKQKVYLESLWTEPKVAKPTEETLGGGITPALQAWYDKLEAARKHGVTKAGEAKKPIIEGRPKYVGESINISKMGTTGEAKDLLTMVGEKLGPKEVIPDKVILAEVKQIHRSVPEQERVLKIIEEQDYHKLKASERLWYKANLQRIAEKEHGNIVEAITTGKINSNADLNEAMDKLLMQQSMLGVMEKHRKVVAEPGRQLRALGLVPKSSSLSDIRQFLKRETTEGEFNIIQKFVLAHPKDHEGLYELLKQFKNKPPTVLQHVLTYQYMNMLSGPKTWGINIFTNLYNLLGVKPVVRVGAGVLSAIRHPVDKAKRAYFASEIFPMYANIGRKAPEAAKLFGKILIGKKEIPSGSKFIKDIGETAVSWRRSNNRVLRAFAPGPEFVYRVMAGSDVAVRLMAAEGEMAALAHRGALQKGLKWGSPEYTKFVEYAKSHDMGMWKKASQFADETVFFEELGTLSKEVEKLRSKVPATKLFIEFFRTIANLKRQEVELVPGLGLAFGARRAAKLGQGYELATKQLIGGAIGYWMWQKAERGELIGTLKGKELQAAKDLGRGSYYIKFGNTWINYSRIWPFNTLLSSVADLNKNYRKYEKGEIEGGEASWNMLHGTINNFMEQTYTSPVAQYLSENLRPGVPAKALGKFLPLSSMTRQFSQVVDMAQNGGLLEGKLPTRELSKDILEKVLDGFESTYFQRHKVPQRVTWAGEQAVSEGGVYQPYWWTKRQESPAEKEFVRLNYGPPRTDDFFIHGGIRYKLKTEHYGELQKQVGKEVKKALEEVVQMKLYKEIEPTQDKTADENKRVILDKVTNQIKDAVRKAYIGSIIEGYIKERRGEREKRGITPQYVGAGR